MHLSTTTCHNWLFWTKFLLATHIVRRIQCRRHTHHIADSQSHRSEFAIIICTKIMHNHDNYTGFGAVRPAWGNGSHVLTVFLPGFSVKMQLQDVSVHGASKRWPHIAQQSLTLVRKRRIVVPDLLNLAVNYYKTLSSLAIIAALFRWIGITFVG